MPKAKAKAIPRKPAQKRVAPGKIKKASAPPSAASDLFDRLDRLNTAIGGVRAETHPSPRTARLLASGVPKMAQKVIEEAGEVAIEAVKGDRVGIVLESVDLLYNLTVLWHGAGIDPKEIWAEMDRRQAILGMAEKLPKISEQST